VKRSINKNI